MTPNQSLSELSSKILVSLDDVLNKEKPDYVFVHGDTTTTAFASISAFYNKIKLCHVEAGLRTHDKFSPFPEEIVELLQESWQIFILLQPKKQCKIFLMKDQKENVQITGNTVVDALLEAVLINKTNKDSQIENLKNLIPKNKKIILVTGHRRENFGEGFYNICKALLDLAKNPSVHIVYPVHLNPTVKYIVFEMLGDNKNITLIDPLEYPAFTWLMNQSYLILTDSGGVQEEAPSLGIPVLVMRENTERPEGVIAKTAFLVGTNQKKILRNANRFLENKAWYDKVSKISNPYGDGNASKKIINFMMKNA